MAKMRVPLSKSPADIIALAKKVYTKHLVEAANSPLNALQDYEWSIIGPNVDEALRLHNQAEALKKEMEKTYRERDLLITPLTGAVKASRDILTGVYSKNMKRMGDWGFVVDDTPKAKPETKPAVDK